MTTKPSPTEQAILDCIRAHEGPVQVRTILADVWGYRVFEPGGVALLRAHVYNLRRKGVDLRSVRSGQRRGRYGLTSYQEVPR